MAKDRRIRAGFSLDAELGREPYHVGLHYILSWNHCDDWGVLPTSETWLSGNLDPYRDKSKVKESFERLRTLGKFAKCPGLGDDYQFCVNWFKHQAAPHPSLPKQPLPFCIRFFIRTSERDPKDNEYQHLQKIHATLTRLASELPASHKRVSCNSPESLQRVSSDSPSSVAVAKSFTGAKANRSSDRLKVDQNTLHNVVQIIQYLNQVTGSKFNPDTKSASEHLIGRLAEGATVEQCIAVINSRAAKWRNDDTKSDYLRPSTLFRPRNFETYLAQVDVAIPDETDQTLLLDDEGRLLAEAVEAKMVELEKSGELQAIKDRVAAEMSERGCESSVPMYEIEFDFGVRTYVRQLLNPTQDSLST